MIETGIILTLMFGGFGLYCKKHHALQTTRVIFIILICMVLPNLLGCEFLEFFDLTINYIDTILFGVLIISGIIPWMEFDRYLYKIRKREMYCTKTGERTLKLISKFIIISSMYSIVYLLPFSIIGLTSDASMIREELSGGDYLLPKSIFTTLCVGLAAFNIYSVLLFYISICLASLKRYRLLLFISSLSNVLAAATFAGRDQFVVVIIFFIVFFLVFKNFMPLRTRNSIKKSIMILIIGVGVGLGGITLQRFNKSGLLSDNTDLILIGTVGYIAQQPLVFNSYIEKQDVFTGMKRAFPLISNTFDLPSKERVKTMFDFNSQFGTMYGTFYGMFGWKSLIIGSLIFWGYYTWGIKVLIRRRLLFNALLMFCVYLYLEITGIFYLKAAGSVMINVFYIMLSLVPFLIKNPIHLRRKSDTQPGNKQKTILNQLSFT